MVTLELFRISTSFATVDEEEDGKEEDKKPIESQDLFATYNVNYILIT